MRAYITGDHAVRRAPWTGSVADFVAWGVLAVYTVGAFAAFGYWAGR